MSATPWRVLWQRPDGSISVTCPGQPPLEGEPLEMYLDGVALRAQNVDPELAGAVRLPSVQVSVLPGRRFRNCWRWSGNALRVDLPLARQQRLKEIRGERDRRLAATDGPWMRSVERNLLVERQQLESQRQALRDLPAQAAADLESCADEAAVAAYQPQWPE